MSRKARLTYGVRGSRRFDHNDPDHVCREEVRIIRIEYDTCMCIIIHTNMYAIRVVVVNFQEIKWVCVVVGDTYICTYVL